MGIKTIMISMITIMISMITIMISMKELGAMVSLRNYIQLPKSNYAGKRQFYLVK